MSNVLAKASMNEEFLLGLELLSAKIHPLAGAIGRRLDFDDPRIKDSAKVGEEVAFYEHLATIRHKGTDKYFVAFRETMDAFLARQTDLAKYPKWLMDNSQKQRERNIYIYLVKAHPKSIPIMKSHEDWLTDFNDNIIFNTIVYFLEKHGIVSPEVVENEYR